MGHILNLHVHKEYSGGSFYPFSLLERIDRHILRATLFSINDLELESFLNHKNLKVQRILKLYVHIYLSFLCYVILSLVLFTRNI